MISLSRLLCGREGTGDRLRFGASASGRPSGVPDEAQRRPIVVWNSTRACNLRCRHCYHGATATPAADELTTAEARQLIDRLADFGVPVLLFSGGEPLLRPDLLELGRYAVDRGLRAAISSNGTLIDDEAAAGIAAAGFSYVGISLDGTEAVHDDLRGMAGAFAATVAGLRRCAEAGLRTGVRLTLGRHNVADLDAILDFVAAAGIPRACFYHLVPVGRGRSLHDLTLTHEETRAALDRLIRRAPDLAEQGTELLTVDNHADGPYLLRHVAAAQPDRYPEVLALLRANGGNASGVGIAAIDHLGDVHPDQFWQSHSFGNVRRRPFGDIWSDTSDPIMAGLKRRRSLLEGRCAACRYLDLCNGNLRVRAVVAHGNPWAPDPACYLTDREISA